MSESGNLTEGHHAISSLDSSLGNYLYLIHPYTGEKHSETSVHDFLDEVREVAELAQWPFAVTRMAIRTKLKGKALEYFRKNSLVKQSRNMDELSRIMINHFSEKNEDVDHLSKLISCRQTVGENVEEFACRLEILRMKVNDSDSEGNAVDIGMKYLLKIFLEGLSDQIRDRMVCEDPTSYRDAVSIATNVEKRLTKLRRTKTHVMSMYSDEPSTKMEKSQCVATCGGTRPILKPAQLNLKDNNTVNKSKQVLPLEDNYSVWEKPRSIGIGAATFDLDPSAPTGTAHWDHNTNTTSRIRENTSPFGPRTGRRLLPRNASGFGHGDDKLFSTPSMGKNTNNNPEGKFKFHNDQSGSYRKGNTVTDVIFCSSAIEALLDPAADQSLIANDIVSRYKLEKNVMESKVLSLEGAGSGRYMTKRCIDLRFKFNIYDRVLTHTFYIVDREAILGHSMILGSDLLIVNNLVLDSYRNNFKFGNTLMGHT